MMRRSNCILTSALQFAPLDERNARIRCDRDAFRGRFRVSRMPVKHIASLHGGGLRGMASHTR